MSVDEVLSHVRKAVLFIEGITVSGGEATTQLPFVVALFTAIKNDPQLRHLTCLVDSNGMLSETGWEKLLPVCDGAMLDLKAWGSECHQQLTGLDNQQIKRSIYLLAERGKLAELRLLVIPGQVDYLQHIEELAAFIKGLGDVPVRLNAFHAHGVYGEAQSWPSATPEDVEQLIVLAAGAAGPPPRWGRCAASSRRAAPRTRHGRPPGGPPGARPAG